MSESSGADERLPNRERAVLGVEAVGERSVSIDEPGREAEELHLLGRPVARADVANVVELAALRRPAKEQRVRERREMRLAEEARQHRDDEEHEQPRRLRRERDAQRDEREHALPHPQQL